MIDSNIKRQVLQELMDLMDQKDRQGMSPDMAPKDPTALGSEISPDAQLPSDDKSPMDDSAVDGKPEPDEDDMPSVDPVVMLARKFKK